VVVIYFSANAYIIDAFPGYVASALAAKTVCPFLLLYLSPCVRCRLTFLQMIRSGSGAAMPLFIVQMFHGLGNGWAASLLAFVSLAMVHHYSQQPDLELTSFPL
jgi:hypothetical protein